MDNENKIDFSSLFFEDKDIPQILYHYTSMETFIEIMKKQSCFYSTHYSFLNDGLEVTYGENLFDAFLQKNYPELSSKYASEFKTEYDKNFAWFISSFSEVDDDLGQWRAYTDRNNGGVSIGFNTKELLQKISYDIFYDSGIELSEKFADFFRDQKPINMLKCMYQENEVEDFLQKNIKWINDAYNISKARPSSAENDKIQSALGGNLTDLRTLTASFAKNSSFLQEREWRIVIWKDFTKASTIILAGKPRLKAFDLDHKSMIASITISPHGNPKRNQQLAEFLCKTLKISTKIIKMSQSSYIG